MNCDDKVVSFIGLVATGGKFLKLQVSVGVPVLVVVVLSYI